MTSSKQTSLFTEEPSTSSPEDSHANHSAMQESGKDQMMNAICGTKCCEQFKKFSQHTLWQKMFVDYLVLMKAWSSNKCVLTWKLKATKYNRYYCLLQVSTLRTEETEYSLLLTPTSVMTDEHPEQMRARAEKNGYQNGTKFGSLLSQVKYSNLLPTPTLMDGQKLSLHQTAKQRNGTQTENASSVQNAKDNMQNANVQGQHKMDLNTGISKESCMPNLLPTPRKSDFKGASKQTEAKGRNPMTNSLMDAVENGMNPGSNGQLNPRFVAEMMGFPTDWTISPFLNGETKA